MYPKNMFDIVITHEKDERDKIMKPTEAFQLQNGSTYTYVSNFSKNFTIPPIQDKEVHFSLA